MRQLAVIIGTASMASALDNGLGLKPVLGGSMFGLLILSLGTPRRSRENPRRSHRCGSCTGWSSWKTCGDVGCTHDYCDEHEVRVCAFM